MPTTLKEITSSARIDAPINRVWKGHHHAV